MKTAAERKRDERARYKAAGLVPVTVYVPRGDRAEVRRHAASLVEEAQTRAQVRAVKRRLKAQASG